MSRAKVEEAWVSVVLQLEVAEAPTAYTSCLPPLHHLPPFVPPAHQK